MLQAGRLVVTLNAVFLIVSQSTSKFSPRTFSNAVLTTPGPLTPTLMIASASVTPWKAPAINGLSSGALQNTTKLGTVLRNHAPSYYSAASNNDLSHQSDGIHVDTCLCGTDIDRTADTFCLGKCLWDRTDQQLISFWSFL